MIRKAMLATALTTILPSTALADTIDAGFALDWKFEGPAAPYFLAQERGYFADAGLDIEIAEGSGSLDAIPKVATGSFPFGFADINSLMRFIDQNPDAPVTAVMMVYDKPPFSIVGRKSLGVESPTDLEGRILGAPPPDGAWAQFPIFAREAGIDQDSMTVEPVGFPVREPMLADGEVDAIAGFSFSSTLNLLRLGVPREDLSVMLMADYGVDLYGNAIIVNTDFAQANPEAVTGFLAAIATGWEEAIEDPQAAVEAMVPANPAIDTASETQRLSLSIEANVLTDDVQANGMGGIDATRMETAIEQTRLVYDFENPPAIERFFDDSYLPPVEERMLE
ncbi:ABC transporter substrate-binding protein [Spiribacter aquaticus]|uniref:ABC transporter substrate-binding protein n=1 Tax=Spiribacter aquaticus TaxID=1935996 RepID=A0A557RMP1_9GAMM|nr:MULTISPECIES: ABC transporter substrate-binding protein [Spiribacter]KAF0279496.1 ABC transporter substrate-binding protein [Spiribacter roseus]TVO66453.1 ABC transporter substrate-binding protein [Spiribacter aquaticus]